MEYYKLPSSGQAGLLSHGGAGDSGGGMRKDANGLYVEISRTSKDFG